MTARATISVVRNRTNTFPAMTKVLVMLIVVAVAIYRHGLRTAAGRKHGSPFRGRCR
jgi:hypothetical protein